MTLFRSYNVTKLGLGLRGKGRYLQIFISYGDITVSVAFYYKYIIPTEFTQDYPVRDKIFVTARIGFRRQSGMD